MSQTIDRRRAYEARCRQPLKRRPGTDWQTATYADPRKIRQWIAENYPNLLVPPSKTYPVAVRALHRWRTDTRASFWSVDRVLTELRLHPSQVPDEAWIR